jgi:hypothetical protein
MSYSHHEAGWFAGDFVHLMTSGVVPFVFMWDVTDGAVSKLWRIR